MNENNVVRISRRAVPWFEEAFRTQALGERVAWEAVFGAAQMPPDGRMTPVFLVYAEMPSSIVGQVVGQFAQIGAPGLTQEAVEKGVAEILAKLHEMRRTELVVTNGDGRVIRGR